MAGLIAGATAPTPAAAPVAPAAAPTGANPGSKLKNPLLQQVESGIEAKVSPQTKQMYLSIVVATMKLAFDAKTHPLLIKGLKSSPDMTKNIALICAGMIGMVYKESKQKPEAFVPGAVLAAMTLMCQILQFAEQSRMIEITPEVVADCTAATTEAVLAKFGIDKGKVKQAVDAGKAKQQGPQAQGAAQPTGGM
jgi:hypothetical protein